MDAVEKKKKNIFFKMNLQCAVNVQLLCGAAVAAVFSFYFCFFLIVAIMFEHVFGEKCRIVLVLVT